MFFCGGGGGPGEDWYYESLWECRFFFSFFFFKHLHFQINVGPRTSFLKAIQMRVDGCDIEKMPQNRSCSKSNKTQDFLQK